MPTHGIHTGLKLKTILWQFYSFGLPTPNPQLKGVPKKCLKI